MKVNFKDNIVTFDSLKKGETFIDPNYDDCAIIIKVEPCGDIHMTADEELTDKEFDGYGVDPHSGSILGYYNEDEVIPIRAEITVFRT